MICDNLSVNEKGNLAFAGFDTLELAEKYSTPLYLMDEDKIRQHIRDYKNTMAECFPLGSVPEYASKAFACKQIYRIAKEEGIDIDVVSLGEIFTADSVGFPMERCFFHGNNKTDYDIATAIEKGVGYFVVDSFDELYALNEIAEKNDIKQKILIRVTPGIDPHTHKKISTGSVESKFGFALETGDAEKCTKIALNMDSVVLSGFHCHIGSQIFESEPFLTASQLMLDFIFDMKNKYGYEPCIFNLGGGLGVRYTDDDPKIDYRDKIREIAVGINKQCEAMGLAVPVIHFEPGRSIVADAGMTLYTVGSVKEIEGYKNYVSVDGGMTDNPRYTLYESPYTIEICNKMNKDKNFVATVAGRCCESGDLIQENVKMSKPSRGDILAVLTTGAYNYSMASNYNRISKPCVVMLSKNGDYVAVKRESIEDVYSFDI